MYIYEIGCPTRYQTQHFWKTESIKSSQQQFLGKFGGRHQPSKSSIWALLKKLETSILISGKIYKEMLSSVASGTHYMLLNFS